jgi:signal peptidase I
MLTLPPGLRALLELAPSLVCRPSRYIIDGESMAPALLSGDAVFVDTRAYRRRPPRQGDIVMVRHPRLEDFVRAKRVIGLPGQRIRIHDGQLLVNDQPVHEAYLQDDAGPGWEVQLGADEYAVLGDNRRGSTDSRDFGPVHRSRFVGRVLYRYLPGNRRGALARADRFPTTPVATVSQGAVYRQLVPAMAMLTGWGLASVVAGFVLRRSTNRTARGMGEQFLAWGAVDALIGALAFRGMRGKQAMLNQGRMDPDQPGTDRVFFTRLLWFNAALDVLYMVGGLRLWQKGATPQRCGAGAGILLQGAFLFGFDAVNAILLRYRS